MSDTDTDCDIYVDLRDEPLTCRLLAGIPGLRAQVADRNARLDLARLSLTGVGAAAAGLRQGPETAAVIAAAKVAMDTSGTSTTGSASQARVDTDAVLAVLRHWAATTFSGWSPTIDRDHDEGAVSTQPHIKVADTDPVKVSAPVAGQMSDFGPGDPRVGVADAIVYAHPDLAGRFVGPCVTAGPFDTVAPGHAAFVSGTILGRAPRARLVCRPVLVHDASTSWDVASRLMAFVDDDLDVLNMSFGCYTDGARPLPLQRAVARLAERTVLVAAVGNDPTRSPLYPAAFGDVLAVGSTDELGQLADDAPRVPWMDVTAQGLGLVGPFLVGDVLDDGAGAAATFTTGYASWGGSSFASAAVTGEIARLMTDLSVDAAGARDALLGGTAASGVSPYAFALPEDAPLGPGAATGP